MNGSYLNATLDDIKKSMVNRSNLKRCYWRRGERSMTKRKMEKKEITTYQKGNRKESDNSRSILSR